MNVITKRYFLVIYITCLTPFIHGQTNWTWPAKLDQNGDTIIDYNWQNEFYKKLKIPNLIYDTTSIYFRFYTITQIVDIWTQDRKIYHGQIVNYIDSSNDNKKQEVHTLSTRVSVDTTLARQAFTILQSIKTISLQDSIKGWRKGFDGTTYYFQYSTPNSYASKYYWQPDDQDSKIVEAHQISWMINQLYQVLKLNHEDSIFIASLAPGNYTIDNHIGIYKRTEMEKLFYVKYRSDLQHLDSIKRTLNQYLSDTLTILLAPYHFKYWNTPFYLDFNSNNQLIKVKYKKETFHTFDFKWANYWHKRKIKRAFKHITINFVHSRIGYSKIFTYSNKRVKIQ